MKILYANLLLVATCHAQASADYRYGRNNANTTVLGDFNVTWTPDEVSQPNATRKVSFEPWTGGIPQNWTWTLAMSELAFADLSLDEPDSRVALTTYTFEWPQGGNVSNTITPSRGNTTTGEKQCIYHFFVNFMPNVSSAWDSDSARCASAIGTECEQYLVSRRWLDPLNDDCIPPTGSSGSGRMAQCMDYMPVGGSVAGYRFDGSRPPVNATVFESGNTVAWTLSDRYSTGNDTVFEAEKNRLHMSVLANSFGTTLLCSRIGDGMESQSAGNRLTGMSTTLVVYAATLFAAILCRLL